MTAGAEVTQSEREAMRAALRDFVAAEVMPSAASRDATGEFPAAAVRRLGELDAMGIHVPVEFGGLGLDTASLLAAVEEVAYGDASLASIYTAHYLGLEPILVAGTEEQKAKYLAPLAQGDLLGAFALTEPDAGSDIASMTTTATPDGEGWRLSGSKTYISNAAEAGVTVVFAKSDRAAGFRGISAFVLPAGLPGVTFSSPQDKSGIRSAPTYTVFFDDVSLPADALLGEAGTGGKLAMHVLNAARIDVAAMANGVARRALHLAVEHATDRVQFSQPLRDFQAIQLLLGEMDAAVEVSRQTALWAGGVRDTGADLRRAGSIAKYVATENCFSVVDKAVQIHGGMGFMRESEIERLFRDCRILRIYEGTSQIQLLTLAGTLTARFDRDGTAS
jgi:alkylation response protein AidB-like acyl-CoA dehydrogenase